MKSLNISTLDSQSSSVFLELNLQLKIPLSHDGIPLFYRETPESAAITVDYTASKILITAPKRVMFCRALGIVKELLENDSLKKVEETARYDQLEAMVDCARNAVLTVEACKRLIRLLALMGYTGLQLYVEDVFEMEKYPYFGYLRGAYSEQELKELDSYCALFGIELIPCIQTLAHLGKALRWECFHSITDFDDILLAEEDASYELIEEMVKTMHRALKSRRINIGMDEAHMLGLGKYLDCSGYSDRMAIMLKHFRRVYEILNRYGYTGMMWSDMFFRLLNGGSYENTNTAAKDRLSGLLPYNMELIYWNYYSTEKKVYDDMLDSHLAISPNTGFAAGAWKWTGFSPYNTFSICAGRQSHKSCMEHGIRHILVTSWGDDGGEASIFTVLPSFQLWAECCYQGDVADEALKVRFRSCTGGYLEDFLLMDSLIETPEKPKLSMCGVNPSRYIFYQDILYGMFDRHISPQDARHFSKTATDLAAAEGRSGEYGYLFRTLSLYASVLAIKANCGTGLRDAYRRGDLRRLETYADDILPRLLTEIDRFSEAYSNQWNRENKIFGLDLFDLRIGGLKERIRRAILRIRQYTEGDIASLEELEQKILYYDCRREGDDSLPLVAHETQWINIVSPDASRNSKSY